MINETACFHIYSVYTGFCAKPDQAVEGQIKEVIESITSDFVVEDQVRVLDLLDEKLNI